MHFLHQKGISLVEIIIAMTIMAMVMLSVARGFMFMNRATVQSKEKSFASQKAIQMMEELRGLIANKSDTSIGVLDDYDDGAVYNTILTTKREVTSAGDVLSGNNKGKFVRRVNVIMLPNEPLARQVFVRVYRASNKQVLAETVSVVRTISNQFVNTQVFDVYILSLENVPGWWVLLSSMKPMFDNVIQDLQTRNPGLEWRPHWVTRLAYGRDPFYTPYVNEDKRTNEEVMPWIYFYPGLTVPDSTVPCFYYVPSSIAGRVNIDGTVQNSWSYSIADQYNHAVRYPDEEAMYTAAVTAAEAAGTTPPEMSLRMLLEKMNSPTGGMNNAMIVNLHGELIPLPPMRNYSDPAKDPVGHANVRIVTHPEKLQYASGSAVKLRAYGYVTNPGSWAQDATLSTMTVLFPSTFINPGSITIRKAVGNGTLAYSWQATTAGVGNDYTITNPGGTQTLITLFNTPLRTALNGGKGLNATKRLYGLEYIPCDLSAAPAFVEGTQDLTTTDGGTARPKNTARWGIQIAAGVLNDGQYTIETRMDDDVTTGVSGNEPTNLSRTYVWVGRAPPVTEQFQFMGDPRHMPYTDVKINMGYNVYFSTIDTADYPGFTGTSNLWNGGPNVDVPRYFQMYRSGLLTSWGLWTSITGYSNYYVGLGGEMGYDASNSFTNSLPIIRTPWLPSSAASANVNEIIDGFTESYQRVISSNDNTWWGLFWLGELYPDSAYATWSVNGNLPVGSAATNFYRARYNAKGFSFDPIKRTSDRGCSSFLNGNATGNNTTYFNHEYWDTNNGTITTPGLTLAQDFNFPLYDSMLARRPFRLNATNNQPPEWNVAAYSGTRTTLTTLETYYEAQGNEATHDSSALLRMKLGTNVATMVMNGLSPQGVVSNAFISKLCVINLTRGFLAAGAPAITTARIPQLPTVTITGPSTTDAFNNPSTINVVWSTAWTRWDSLPYTSGYPASYSESTSLTGNVKYSNDNGKHWYFINTDGVAKVGVKSAAQATLSPISWNVSALPRGTYVLRIEVYRDTIPLHYSYAQRQVYIKR